MIRKKAIGVDLSDVEQLRLQLESNHKYQHVFQKNKTKNIGEVMDEITKNTDNLMSVTEIDNKKKSCSYVTQIKSQMIRNRDKLNQPGGMNQTEKE